MPHHKSANAGTRLTCLALTRLALAHPRAALAFAAILLVIAAAGLPRLELRTDGRALVPPNDPVVVHDDQVRREFGLRDAIVVVITSRHADGIYNSDTLGQILDVTNALLALDGVESEQVVSLATERGDRVRPGTLEFRSFIDRYPDTPELVAQVRGDVEAVDVLHGTLVSMDHRSTAILVGVPLGKSAADSDLDRAELYRRITEVVEPLAGSEGISVVGAPVAEALLGQHIVQDLMQILPLAIALIAFVLWLGCRRPWGVMLGLAEVGSVQIFVFGTMGWLGVPVYLTTAVLPVVLVTLGLADEIHIFWRYQDILEREPRDEAGVPEGTMHEMTRPVMLTSITTSLGFLSFCFSPLPAVQGFGAFAALGIAFCLSFSLGAVPAALVLLGPERLRRPRSGSRTLLSRGPNGTQSWPSRLGALLSYPRTVVFVLIAVTLTAALGIGRIIVQDSWLDGFASGSQFRVDTDRVNENFHGTHLLLLDITLASPDLPISGVLHGEPGPLLLPDRLWKIGQLENFVRQQPKVGGVLGPYSQMLTASFLRHGRQERFRTLPSDPPKVAKTLYWFAQARGEHRVRELYHENRHRGIVTVFLKSANYRDTADLIDAIRLWEAEHFQPVAMEIAFAGDVAVSQAMIPVIVRTQIGSLLIALLGSWIVVSLLLKSWVEGLWIVTPTGLAITWVLGAMGWIGIPLGVATSMFCAITLGIGVDYGIHFHHAHQHFRELGTPRPVLRALDAAGPAILTDTLAIALGFGLLTLSQVPANARLGMLVALALCSTCILTLVGLGAVLDNRDRAGSEQAVTPASS